MSNTFNTGDRVIFNTFLIGMVVKWDPMFERYEVKSNYSGNYLYLMKESELVRLTKENLKITARKKLEWRKNSWLQERIYHVWQHKRAYKNIKMEV